MKKEYKKPEAEFDEINLNVIMNEIMTISNGDGGEIDAGETGWE